MTPPPGGWCIDIYDRSRPRVVHFYRELPYHGPALSMTSACGYKTRDRRRPRAGALTARLCVKCEAIVTRAR